MRFYRVSTLHVTPKNLIDSIRDAFCHVLVQKFQNKGLMEEGYGGSSNSAIQIILTNDLQFNFL